MTPRQAIRRFLVEMGTIIGALVVVALVVLIALVVFGR